MKACNRLKEIICPKCQQKVPTYIKLGRRIQSHVDKNGEHCTESGWTIPYYLMNKKP